MKLITRWSDDHDDGLIDISGLRDEEEEVLHVGVRRRKSHWPSTQPGQRSLAPNKFIRFRFLFACETAVAWRILRPTSRVDMEHLCRSHCGDLCAKSTVYHYIPLSALIPTVVVDVCWPMVEREKASEKALKWNQDSYFLPTAPLILLFNTDASSSSVRSFQWRRTPAI